jgi:hypothetical protein
VFHHACKLGLEGIVSKRKDSRCRSGRSLHWIKSKNPNAPAVKREAEEDQPADLDTEIVAFDSSATATRYELQRALRASSVRFTSVLLGSPLR